MNPGAEGEERGSETKLLLLLLESLEMVTERGETQELEGDPCPLGVSSLGNLGMCNEADVEVSFSSRFVISGSDPSVNLRSFAETDLLSKGEERLLSPSGEPDVV